MSDADTSHFDQQANDAIAFLQMREDRLRRLVSLHGVDYAGLDFAIAMRSDLASQSTKLPAALISLAAKLGLGIELSHYAVSPSSS
jgi:hypothetical protein